MAEVGAATDGLKWVGRATTEDMVAVIVERYIHVERSTSLWMDGTESWRHCSLVKGGANGAVGHVPRRAREPRQVVIVIVYTMLHGTALEGEAHWWEYIHPRVQATEIIAPGPTQHVARGALLLVALLSRRVRGREIAEMQGYTIQA